MDEVQSVHLLGNAQALPFQLTAEGLIVTLPTQKLCDHSYVLRITGLDLKASRSAPPPLPVIQVAAVSTMTLLPNSATLSGAGIIQLQTQHSRQRHCHRKNLGSRRRCGFYSRFRLSDSL